MIRYAAGVEYDGSRFAGWQAQPHARTVQGAIEAALSKVANRPVTAVCAGRTDAGVHATGQVIHFDTDAPRAAHSWLLGVNSNLDPDVALQWVQPAPAGYHARFSALARHYRYTIVNRLARPALGRERIAWVYRPLDAQVMQTATHGLVGEHDFSAFRAAECQAASPMRRIHHLAVARRGERVVIDIVANGFLHHMVRNVAGVLIAVGSGKASPDWPAAVLASRDRTAGGVTAPASGLCFMGVCYPPECGWSLDADSRVLFNAIDPVWLAPRKVQQ
ncbi:MAG TPA: tRNA pseudouridine(38-40) synthase TruA [Gammaproteobacteria bacterium]|nr:tRNA pseudouridine(38-40) synthase TruA [Gammaproteobacteria bacterium]